MSEITPEQMRAASRKDVSDTVSRMTSAGHGMSQSSVAEACGVKASRVQRWADALKPDQPQIADIPQMPRDLAVALLRLVAESHHVAVVDSLEADTVGDHLEQLDRTISDCSAAHGEHMRAIADGIVTPAEHEAMIERYKRVVHTAMGIIRGLESTRGEAIGVRLHSVDGGAA